MQLLFKSNIMLRIALQHISMPDDLFLPSNFCLCDICLARQGNYFAEKGLKTKKLISAGFVSHPGSLCSCVNAQRERIVMTVRRQRCGGWTTPFSSDLGLSVTLKATELQ